MEFFIKKNATLPVLKINLIKDGRSDYDRSMKFLNETEIFFSMVDTENGTPKITSRPAGIMKKIPVIPNQDDEYYIYYQFTPLDTKKVARYKGQFLLRNETGIINLPLNQELYINVTDSFVLDDMEFTSCYVVDYPCCKSNTLIPPPNPVTTTTTNPVTTTTTNPVTTTTTNPVTTTTTVYVTTTTTVYVTTTTTVYVTTTTTV